MNWIVTQNLKQQLDLEANHQVIGKQINIIQPWEWKGVCYTYKNPISEFDVGQISSENKGKTYRAHVSTTRGGTMWNMD
jgi:hypothetical protein